ncbi:MAG: bifunctional molybdopterin-guanine dinucleotide biosynthesis adaptor protein MobB/molybdopterin molybdotransferase MoeA [Thiolinea sp.]
MSDSTKTQAQQLITGVILAGGMGRRLGGQDKGLVKLNGKPLVDYLLTALKPQLNQVLINANRNQEVYQRYGVDVVSDQLSDFQGPLAGFSTALQHVDTPWIMTLPCDGPEVAPDMAQRMLDAVRNEGAELAVAHDGERLQPVHALIPVALLESLNTFLASGERKIDRWYAQHKMATVDFSDVPTMFRNMNTPEQKLALEDAMKATPIVGICAYSGTGKTTLLTQLIPLLKAEGLNLTVIKHGHHKIELDQPGKDSFKFREAGADQVILAASTRMAIMQECSGQTEPSLQDAMKLVNPDCADLILVEGFKHEAFPKLEVHRPVLNKPLLFPEDKHIIALICDTPPEVAETTRNILQLDLNAPEDIVQFIMARVVNGNLPLPPALKLTKSSDQDAAGRFAGKPQQSENNTTGNTIRSAPSCADASDPDSLSLQEARQNLMAAVKPLTSYIKRPLRDTLGQVLAGDIISPLNVPAHTNSAMDGYALAGSGLPVDTVRDYPVVGTAFAGKPFNELCETGQCVRIMTGAIMPEGTDTVVMQEQSEALSGERVRLGCGHKAGQNVRHAGEDIAAGQTVLIRGRRITAADMGLLASLGIAETEVYRRPRVAFFSTGDELRSIGEPLETGCIYDSNRYTLYSLLSDLGMDIIDMGVVPDEPELLEAAFREASANADVVITSGGVSVGEADYIKGILSRLGEMNFWKIAIKPGRPLTFGRLGDALFFGLPGNPVAVMVTFHLFVKPALIKLAGERDYEPLLVQAACQNNLRKKPGRTELLRAILHHDDQGRLTVEKAGHQGSGILTSMSRANCFIVLPETNAGVSKGDLVTVQPFGHI